MKELLPFPKVHRDLHSWFRTVGGLFSNHVGIDFEFTRERPHKLTVLGLSDGGIPVSIPWSEEARERVLYFKECKNVSLSGHNFFGAEKPFIEEIWGEEIPVERIEDTMILSYLVNAEFCSMPKTGGDGENGAGDIRRGMGMLDLWTTASLYTDLRQWKLCRGGSCSGPCPTHAPFEYNGVDAFACDIMVPKLRRRFATKRIPESLYTRVKILANISERMRQKGVNADWDLIETLKKKNEDEKENLFRQVEVEKTCGVCARMTKSPPPCKGCRENGPPTEFVYETGYNPNSDQQVMGFFKDKFKLLLGDNKKDTVQESLEKMDKEHPAHQELTRLFDYKDAGQGFDPWFKGTHRWEDGLVHPRLNPCGTATGRFSQSSPNFQNIPKVGFGKEIRRAIIPRSKDLELVRADYKQLELRMCLWYSYCLTNGEKYPTMKFDPFDILVEQTGNVFERASKKTNRSKRDMAKSVSHAADYLEGIILLTSQALTFGSTKKLVEAGALRVHKDWEYAGGIVAFTGVNLARRLFGSASHANRKKALDLQDVYFSSPLIAPIRDWHRKVLKDIEDTGYVQSHSGRYLELIEAQPEKRAKDAVAFLGQGGGADYVQEAMVKYWGHGTVPLLMVHDELVFERNRGAKDHEEFIRVMEEPSKLFDGFYCPIDWSVGDNWLEASG